METETTLLSDRSLLVTLLWAKAVFLLPSFALGLKDLVLHWNIYKFVGKVVSLLLGLWGINSNLESLSLNITSWAWQCGACSTLASGTSVHYPSSWKVPILSNSNTQICKHNQRRNYSHNTRNSQLYQRFNFMVYLNSKSP